MLFVLIHNAITNNLLQIVLNVILNLQDDTLSQMAELLSNEPNYKEKDASRVLEDLQFMSDHELHRLVKSYDVSAMSCLTISYTDWS